MTCKLKLEGLPANSSWNVELGMPLLLPGLKIYSITKGQSKMLDHLVSRALVDGILNADSKTKGHLGQQCAAHLGLEACPLGKNGGIDGVGFINQQKIYFQSKLINRPLNAEFADSLYGNLVRHKRILVLF
jgi:hypothetical protein